MTPRPLLPLLLLLLLFSNASECLAQPARHEIAASYGRSRYAQLSDTPTAGLSYARFWTAGGVATRLGAHWSERDFPDEPGGREIGVYFAIAEYHFFRNRTVSPYAGAGIAYAHVREDRARFSAEDSTLAAIAAAGVDFNVHRNFAIAVDGRWMKFDPELGDRFGSRLDPITLFGTVKYRF